jgi:two-component system response regulator VanR
MNALRVLIIDDEKALANVIEQALRRAGFQVEIASDGTQGVEKYDRAHFDVVVTDVKMPGLSGKQVTEHIRRSGKPLTPVLAISGTPWELAEESFDDILPKPFSLKVLLKKIRDLCAKTSATAETG